MVTLKFTRRVRCTGCGAIGTEYHPYKDGYPVFLTKYRIHQTVAICRCHPDISGDIAWMERELGESVVMESE